MKNPVAVYNAHNREYVEKWMGEIYRVPANKAIVMARRDAIRFMGNYSGDDPDNPGVPKVKMLRIRPVEECQGIIVSRHEEIAPDKTVYVCNFDGKEFPTQAALDEHLLTHDDVRDSEPDKLFEPHDLVQCPFCGKRDLKGSTGLATHLRQCPKVKGHKLDDDTERVVNLSESPVS